MTIILHIPYNENDRDGILNYVKILYPKYTFNTIIDYDQYNKYTIVVEEDISKRKVENVLNKVKLTSLHFYSEDGRVFN